MEVLRHMPPRFRAAVVSQNYKKSRIMRFSVLIGFILSSIFLFSQESNKENVYMDKSFEYSRIDTAFNHERVDRIRYINQSNKTEFYINFTDYDGIVETGHLKQGIYYGLWCKYNSDGKIIKALDFDTLLIQGDDILKIAMDNNFDLDVYEITFNFEPYEGWGPKENHWIISKDVHYKASNSREITGISISAISGEENPYEFIMMDHPVWPNHDTPPKFDEKYGSLEEFLIKNSRYPISEKAESKNAVFVSFAVNEMGELKNISTFKANTGFYKREAVRLVELMPNWLPAKLNRKAVECSHHVISINFK